MRRDAACHQAYPRIDGDFQAAFAKGIESVVTTHVTNSVTKRAVVFDEYSFGSTIQGQTVTVDEASKLPRAVHRAASGDWSLLGELAAAQALPPESDSTTS